MALLIGMFQLAFFFVAWTAHPDIALMTHQATDLPTHNPDFLYLCAALIGAVFNPWMVFYQQSATADKQLKAGQLRAARWDTACGAVLTQLLTASVLVAAAATMGAHGPSVHLDSVADVSAALTPLLGPHTGKLIFSMGVLGAALVAAIVSSLALAWGIGEVAGYQRSLELRPRQAPWFYAVYAVAIAGSAALVWLIQDMVWLTIGAQVINALMLPLVIGFLIALARTLPVAQRLKGPYLWLLVVLSIVVCGLGLWGGISGLV